MILSWFNLLNVDENKFLCYDFNDHHGICSCFVLLIFRNLAPCHVTCLTARTPAITPANTIEKGNCSITWCLYNSTRRIHFSPLNDSEAPHCDYGLLLNMRILYDQSTELTTHSRNMYFSEIVPVLLQCVTYQAVFFFLFVIYEVAYFFPTEFKWRCAYEEL